MNIHTSLTTICFPQPGITNQINNLINNVIKCHISGKKILVVHGCKHAWNDTTVYPLDSIIELDAFNKITRANYGVTIVDLFNNNIEIKSANYGCVNFWIDVSPTLKEYQKRGQGLLFKDSKTGNNLTFNHYFGDVALNHIKSLELVLLLTDRKYEVSLSFPEKLTEDFYVDFNHLVFSTMRHVEYFTFQNDFELLQMAIKWNKKFYDDIKENDPLKNLPAFDKEEGQYNYIEKISQNDVSKQVSLSLFELENNSPTIKINNNNNFFNENSFNNIKKEEMEERGEEEKEDEKINNIIKEIKEMNGLGDSSLATSSTKQITFTISKNNVKKSINNYNENNHYYHKKGDDKYVTSSIFNNVNDAASSSSSCPKILYTCKSKSTVKRNIFIHLRNDKDMVDHLATCYIRGFDITTHLNEMYLKIIKEHCDPKQDRLIILTSFLKDNPVIEKLKSESYECFFNEKKYEKRDLNAIMDALLCEKYCCHLFIGLAISTFSSFLARRTMSGTKIVLIKGNAITQKPLEWINKTELVIETTLKLSPHHIPSPLHPNTWRVGHEMNRYAYL